DPQAYWQLLQQGRDAISEVPPEHWDVDAYYDPDPAVPGKTYTRYGGFVDHLKDFDAAFFGIAPREALSLDPQQRLLLEVAWEAIESAGMTTAGLAERTTGVFVGVSSNDYAYHLLNQGAAQIDAYLSSGNAHSTTAGRLSYLFGFTGPCLPVDTACSSSLVALHLACTSLRSRESDAALVGGVNRIISPLGIVNFSKARMLATDGRCKTFDISADGFVRSEGCGVVLLKRLRDAQRDGDRVLALIRGSAINQIGRTSGLTVPSGPAQQAVIRKALQAAQVAPGQINYLEAQGTGTSLGDPIEVGALGAVFGDSHSSERPLMVGSVKTNIGHAEAAAGMASLIKVVLQLQ
ncbi:MAG: polyketide synthase, partial [Lacisediminimonas sp.]|nr:polyketide synthase [Lacisediminimonas sp.]